MRNPFPDVIQRLKAIRCDKGLSQDEVARLMGTSQSHVSELEAGHEDIRVSTLARYAESLGATLVIDIERGAGA